MTQTVSALIIAHNEEAIIEQCLKSLSFADEIVVVLDNCTDGTKKICEKYTNRLIEGNWEIEGDRRNLGIKECKSDWVLEVDADEVVPKETGKEIKEAIQNPDLDIIAIGFECFVGDRKVIHGLGVYFSKAVGICLFRKGVKIWGTQRAHPKIEFKSNRKGGLKNKMLHYAYQDVSDMFKRLNSMTTGHALDMIEDGSIENETLFHNIRRIISRFAKGYFRGKGRKEGIIGFIFSFCAGLYPIISYLKAKQMLEDKSHLKKKNGRYYYGK